MISAKKYHQEIHASQVWYWYIHKPITKPLYTSNIQHDPQFTIGIKGNKMCFPVEIHIHLTSLITQDSSSSKQYFVARWHYDEVNEWMLPKILSTTLYLEHSQWTFASVDHAFRFLSHWSAVYRCQTATTVFCRKRETSILYIMFNMLS